MTNIALHQHKNPCSGGHNIYNYCEPFLGHHYCILSVSEPCSGVEKKYLLRINQFNPFYPKITSPRNGGHEMYNFLFP